jgi:hypothetical protein
MYTRYFKKLSVAVGAPSLNSFSTAASSHLSDHPHFIHPPILPRKHSINDDELNNREQRKSNQWNKVFQQPTPSSAFERQFVIVEIAKGKKAIGKFSPSHSGFLSKYRMYVLYGRKMRKFEYTFLQHEDLFSCARKVAFARNLTVNLFDIVYSVHTEHAPPIPSKAANTFVNVHHERVSVPRILSKISD